MAITYNKGTRELEEILSAQEIECIEKAKSMLWAGIKEHNRELLIYYVTEMNGNCNCDFIEIVFVCNSHNR
jgi:hypothetical protein